MLNNQEILQILSSNNPLETLLDRYETLERVRDIVLEIDHEPTRIYLNGLIADLENQSVEKRSRALEDILSKHRDIRFVKEIANLGLITIAYNVLLENSDAQDVLIQHGDMFSDKEKETELLIENHIVRSRLYENAEDLEVPSKIKKDLIKLRKKVDSNIRQSLDKVITWLEEYQLYVKRNYKHDGIELGHHQLLPGFRLRDKDSILLQYATGAGKTYVAMQSIQTLLEDNPKAKILVITPKQAISEGTWTSESIEKFGIKAKVKVMEDGENLNDANVVIVNYEKLPRSRKYLDKLLEFAEKSSLFVIDEGHNIRNPDGEISTSAINLLAINNPKRLVLTATPNYNSEEDLGIFHYLVDPVRWSDYVTQTNGRRVKFSYGNKEDLVSLIEMREKSWWEFDLDAVKDFFNLPELTEEVVRVPMQSSDADRYFDIYKDILLSNQPQRSLAKCIKLEKTYIESLINSPDFIDRIAEYIKNGYVVNVFTRLKEGVIDVLESKLSGIVDKDKIGIIEGGVSSRDRVDIQGKLKNSSIDVLINQWDCGGEAFSEVAGNRPIVVLPLMCPFAPGQRYQIIGRSYRPGQLASVIVEYIIPESNELSNRILEYIEELSRREGIYKRETWQPTLLGEDSYNSSDAKMENFYNAKRIHKILIPEAERLNSIQDWIKIARSNVKGVGIFRARRSIRSQGYSEHNTFSRLVLDALRYIGQDYNPENFDNNLAAAYSRPDILLTSAGKINLALATIVNAINLEEKVIADFGCSTMPFAQAYILVKTLENLSKEREFDTIINIDGHENALDYGREVLEKGEWIDVIRRLESLDDKLKDDAVAYLNDSSYYNEFFSRLSFLHGNFVYPILDREMLDVVVISQALQYNNQRGNRDIERIFVNVNNALKPKGNAIITMSGYYGRGQSSTRTRDFEHLQRLVETYGFDVLRSGQLGGDFFVDNTTSPVVTIKRPLYYIHAEKVGGVNRLTDQRSEPFVIYSGEKRVVSGGRVNF